MFPWMVILACGCVGSEPARTAIDTAPPAPFDASCVLAADNALRVWCTATVDEPGPIRVELEGEGTALRTFESESESESEQTHTMLAWGLHAATDYRWRVIDTRSGDRVEGQVSTGALPAVFGSLGIEVRRADASTVQAVLLAPDCPASTAVILDADGTVIWYQSMANLGLQGPIDAMTPTDRGTIVVTVGRSTVVEFDLGGRVQMRSVRGADFAHPVHHALFARDGYVYAIQSTTEQIDGADYVVDGVYVIDGSGAVVDSASLSGLYPPSSELYMLSGYWANEFPGAVDFSHTNSVHVDEAGDLWLSFRHLHAFAKLRGGPGEPGFGELLWTVVGDATSPIAGLSDLGLVEGEPGFDGQHDVNLAPDGTILMFDNGLGPGRNSRGVRYALDPQTRTLREVDAWDLGLHCSIRGGLRELPGGNVLATCATAGWAREYAPRAPDWSWQLETICGGIASAQFAQGIPIELDP